MKTGTLATRLTLAAILLTVLIYFGVNVAAYFNDPFTTTLAYGYTSESAVTVAGYVVREEEVLTGQGDLIYVSRREGEKVSQGGTVALIYPSQEALDNANTLRDLEEQLQQLLQARNLTGGTLATARLDEAVSASLVDFRSELAQGSLEGAASAGEALRSAVLQRSYAYTGTEALEASIASLQAQVSDLTAAGSGGATRITAPQGGIFSSLVDGYETVLTPDMLEDMTCQDYRDLPAASGGGSVGKMIYGTEWYYVTLMRTDDMGSLKVGDSVTLRFQTGLDRDLTMTVERISDEDSGQRLGGFSSSPDLNPTTPLPHHTLGGGALRWLVFPPSRYLNLTTLLRHQNAQIIFDSYTGIRVPRSAVRILWEDVTDEDGEVVYRTDGTPEQEQVVGVYCLWGTTARFKPVEVVWQGEDYILVTPAEGTTGTRVLRDGDQVITAAEDLYDGKVIE